jgi:hypothetical protein
MSSHVGESRSRERGSLKDRLRDALDIGGAGSKERILASAFWIAGSRSPAPPAIVAPINLATRTLGA